MNKMTASVYNPYSSSGFTSFSQQSSADYQASNPLIPHAVDTLVDEHYDTTENAKYSVFEIANWFLLKESMSHKKLQKLCYYAQAWF